jgi:hypothetical protein
VVALSKIGEQQISLEIITATWVQILMLINHVAKGDIGRKRSWHEYSGAWGGSWFYSRTKVCTKAGYYQKNGDNMCALRKLLILCALSRCKMNLLSLFTQSLICFTVTIQKVPIINWMHAGLYHEAVLFLIFFSFMTHHQSIHGYLKAVIVVLGTAPWIQNFGTYWFLSGGKCICFYHC